MSAKGCTRCAQPVKVACMGLCASCLDATGFPSEATAVREATAAHETAYAAAVVAERERILAIVSLPEAADRKALALKLAAVPSMTQQTALTILAAAPGEAPSGPAAEFAAELARCRGHALAVESEADVDAETAYVRRQVARDERLLAERQTGSQEMANTPNTRRDP